ncbi:MAG: hypothetical protein ACFFE4_14575 [Candidatus Thorarchaeota archaeon]
MEIIAQSTRKYLNFLHPAYVSAVTTMDLFGLTEVQLLSIIFICAGAVIAIIIFSYFFLRKRKTV